MELARTGEGVAGFIVVVNVTVGVCEAECGRYGSRIFGESRGVAGNRSRIVRVVH